METKAEKNPNPDQGNGFGCTKTEKGEGFVMIDVESFGPLLHRDLPSTPTFTRSLSRKGSGRNYSERRIHYDPNGVEKETSIPQPQLLAGLGTPDKLAAGGDHRVGPIDLTATSTAVPTADLPVHHTTVTAGSISDQTERRVLAFSKKTSLKRSPTSWILDPKKVVLFFATLSSVGSILLIIFTLSMTNSSGD